MFAVVLVLLVNRGALSTLSLEGSSAYNINRAQTGTAATLYIMALYYFFFSNTLIKKVLLGGVGILLSVLNLVISDSRTSVLTFIVITMFYAFYIIRYVKKHIFSVLALFGALFLGATLSFPFISQSNAYARFSKILFFMQEYTLTGSTEFDRIDLFNAGFSEFLKSPIWGGSVFIPGSLYTHFAPLDILMTTGIIGAAITIVICIGMFRGFVFFLKEKQTSWICALSIAFFINCLTSGCSFSIISYIPALLLIADAMRMETPLPLYNKIRISLRR
ncbi:MAG: O-antigen ligase family protein [Opitutales bacterium]|nr:O-antigen ligase family protein [Opitutales bacterium]